MEVSLETVFSQAAEFHKRNNFKEASKLYEKILNFDPNHQPTLINLGNIFNLTGDLLKAKYCFEKLLLLDSQNIGIIFKLSIIFYKLNDLKNSLINFNKLVQINPDLINLRYNLANILRSKKILNLKKTHPELIKNLFLILFKENDIDHSAISNNALLLLYERDDLKNYLNKKNLISKTFIKNLIQKEIFQLILQKTVITNYNLEKILTDIRREFFLEKIVDQSLNQFKYQNFLVSLAEQCWLNEYIWFVKDDELQKIKLLKDKIEQNEKIDEKEIALLGCYISLNSSEIIKKKLINYKSKNILFNDLINLQIKEPNIELGLKRTIKSVSEINNKISQNVREQYEENPYPRWRYCNQPSSIDFDNDFNFQISPNILHSKNKLENLKILLAGCGTGKHLMAIGKYKNSSVLAVDLSLSSLAYAKRKANELSYNHIDFLHSDILNLDKLNKEFDVIESVGTLHHMENPLDGLKILLKMLKPNGLLRLGLYSEIARKEIVKLREIINKKNFKRSLKDIRLFRKFIISENKSSDMYKSIFNKDFYTTSNVRDLLFHIKEHRYTIPEIDKILNDQNLEFLGFVFGDNSVKIEYSKMFPEDKNNVNLQNWHKFELKYPKTFMSMYQFWVKKN